MKRAYTPEMPVQHALVRPQCRIPHLIQRRTRLTTKFVKKPWRRETVNVTVPHLKLIAKD